MARKSVMELSVKDVIASGNQAAVRFENRTPIRSFYDAASIREVLSPAEQENLDGAGDS